MRKKTTSTRAICAGILVTLRYNPSTSIVMDNPIDKLSQLRGKKPLSVKDITMAETKLGVVFPEEMKELYLRVNGPDLFSAECIFHSPITNSEYEISQIFPLKGLVEGTLIKRIEENRNPNLIEFAIAFDFSRFAIDLTTGNIYNYKFKEIKWYFTKEGRRIFFDVSTYHDQADNFWRDQSGPFKSDYAYYLGDKTLVADSFSEFLKNLTIEIEAGDEPAFVPKSRHTDFWGDVVYEEYMGFKASRKVVIPELNIDADVYVGKAFNNNGDEITTPPTEKKLDEYEQTLQTFLDNKDSIVKDIIVKAYKYYKDRYADYYEVPFKVLFPNDMIMPPSDTILHEPLGITTPEEHLHYMTFETCDHIRVLPRKTIIIPIQYAIDEEHGMEIKIVNGKVKAVQEKGISECE